MHRIAFSQRGYSLVEILVALAVLGILAGIAVVSLPNISKRARDAQRLTDLRQLQTVLEREITTVNTYPTSTGDFEIKDHSWGSLWSEYDYRLPRDPLPKQKYIYVSDGLTYQLYAKFEDLPVKSSFACPAPCGPDGAYNAGIAGGSPAAEQNLLSWNSQGTGSTVGASGVIPTESNQPYTPLAQGKQSYTVDGSGSPQLVSLEIDSFDPVISVTQTIRALLRDASSVTSVTVVLKTDNGIKTFPLSLSSGTDQDGMWSASWVTTDTHEIRYIFTIRATSSSGSSDQYVITVRSNK